MAEHARLSPSGAYRWTRCPGSVREEAKYPERSSSASIDGTHSHSLLEECIQTDTWDAKAFVGQTLVDHEGQFVVDEKRATRVQYALDYLKDHPLRTPLSVVHSELKVDIGEAMGRDDCWGTSDIVLVSEYEGHPWLEIIDYKDGWQPVDPEENLQLLLYAIGAAHQLDIVDRDAVVRLTIVQPKRVEQGGLPVTHWELRRGELYQWLAKLSEAAKATDPEDAPLVPGEHCRWCRAAGSCRAQADQHLAEAQLAFSEVSLVDQTLKSDPATLTDDHVAQLLDAAPLIREFLDAVEKEALRRLQAGQRVPGYKVVHGRGRYEWAEEPEEIEKALKGMGLRKSEILETKLRSPAQIKKITRLSDRQRKRLEETLIRRKEGRLTVAPISDPRPPVEVDAAEAFAEVTTTVTEPPRPQWLTSI